ncbi:MAG: IS200/IS605 family element transposase accessory protein TnpB, partial [Synechococcus sp. SB0670_bin_20]|nr:IS200/IS605 family element transposase accessory protein TnpB [Synechococcus sp. SB0670_bin_20]
MAKAHATRADKRSDHLHKLSTRLIRENQTVVLEDLNVSGMVKNRKLARAIAGAGWQLLRTLLQTKARIKSEEGEPSADGC